jgi:hypothetical protein
MLFARAREHYRTRRLPSPKASTTFMTQKNFNKPLLLMFPSISRLTKHCSSSAVVNASNGSNPPLFGGIVALVMSIATMLRVTRNMPGKVLDAAVGGAAKSPTLTKSKSKTQARQRSKLSPEAVKAAEDVISMKRLVELDEKVKALLTKPVTMPADKEEMLQAAVSRISTLEEELAATKKV